MAVRGTAPLSLLLLVAGVVAGCGNGSGAAPDRAPLTLIALRTQTGNPPQRSFVTLRADGTHRRVLRLRLPPGLTPGTVVPARAGQRLLATASRSPSDSRESDIFSFAAEGAQGRRLTTTGDAALPVPEPDGSRIAYARLATGASAAGQIWLMGADGEHERRLVAGSPSFIDIPGAWSPDGRRLAFTRCLQPRFHGAHDFEDRCAIYVVGNDGRGLRRLATRALLPDWSPDGERIAFVSTRDHTGLIAADSDTDRYAGELYVMQADGSGVRRLTRTPRLDESSPRWSPGGHRIAYVRRGYAFGARLFQVNADGTCPLAITPASDAAWYQEPSWSPQSPARDEPIDCH